MRDQPGEPDMAARASRCWPDAADEILLGDQAVMLASVTPAGGVVLGPMTNFAVRDREAGTITVNSSIGVAKKLERMRQNPRVALAYHTRAHGFSDRPEYVLVQGTVSISPPVADYPASIGDNWERFDGPRARGPLWDWWLRIYHTRVAIELAVERMIVWPDLACRGASRVYGAALPTESPAPQRRPTLPLSTKIDHRRAAKRAARLPHVLLGWVGQDGLPVVVPVEVTGADEHGIVIEGPRDVIPPGRRRAGLTAHWFSRHVSVRTSACTPAGSTPIRQSGVSSTYRTRSGGTDCQRRHSSTASSWVSRPDGGISRAPEGGEPELVPMACLLLGRRPRSRCWSKACRTVVHAPKREGVAIRLSRLSAGDWIVERRRMRGRHHGRWRPPRVFAHGQNAALRDGDDR